MKEPLKFTVFAYPDGENPEQWVFLAVERYIAAQGETFLEAMSQFEHVMLGQIILDLEAGQEPLSRVQPAPKFYQRLKEKGWGHKYGTQGYRRKVFPKGADSQGYEVGWEATIFIYNQADFEGPAHDSFGDVSDG